MAPKKEIAQAMEAAAAAATPQEKENAARAVARFGGNKEEMVQAYLYLRSNAARRALAQVPAFRYRHGVRLR